MTPPKLATALESMLPVASKDLLTPAVIQDAPVVAVVDEFPTNPEFFEATCLSSKPAKPGTHGLLVAALSAATAFKRATTKCYSSSTETAALRQAFDILKSKNDVKVVNFSGILGAPSNSCDVADKDNFFSSFYNLCCSKHVVIAIGNDFSALSSADVKQRDVRFSGGSPGMLPFLQEFTKWCQWPLGLIHFRTLILIHPR